MLLEKRIDGLPAHHAAMDYAKAPAFNADLREREGAAARSGEALGARWPEIDLSGKV
jgi:hypothetical protein